MKKIFVLTVPVVLFVLQASGCTRSDEIQPGGVYRSESAGASFEQSVTIKNVTEEDEVQHIAGFTLGNIFRNPAKPDHILVAAYDNGIIRSEDDGQTWEVLKTPLSSTTDVLALDNGVLVASGIDEAGQGFIIRSLDDGLGWDLCRLKKMVFD